MIPHTETNLNGTNINSFPKSIQNTNEFSENSKKEPLPCLYVGDLSLNLSEIDVEKIFSKIVPIKSVKIYRDITSGESLGYCFVEFENFKDAEKALNALNYYYDPEKMKKPFRLMWYQQDKNLRKYLGGNIFLKDLPLDFTSKNLEKMFFEFGKILSCKVALDESGRSLGYGFVHFENENASKEAIQKTNGVVIGGKKIFVGPFYSKKERKIDGKPKQGFTNIYIKNILIENCNEKFIKDLFDIFGKITSIYIPKFTNRIKGIAFVNFEFPEEAEEAVFGMNKKKIKNLTLYVGKAETKVERQRNLKKKFLERKINPVEKPQNSILIKINIPISITEDVLISKITSVVIIKNCKVLFNSNKDLKKHSFVWFYNLEFF